MTQSTGIRQAHAIGNVTLCLLWEGQELEASDVEDAANDHILVILLGRVPVIAGMNNPHNELLAE